MSDFKSDAAVGPPLGWVTPTLGEVAENLDWSGCRSIEQSALERVGHVPYYGATGRVRWIDEPLFD